MTEEEVLAEFRASHALLEGHFLLSSGRHSAHYLQCARVLMDPQRAGRLALALAQTLPRDLRGQIQKVVSPAMGGIIIGHEMGRALGVEAIFVERP
jgi:orotate phosphoribosyltransferase